MEKIAIKLKKVEEVNREDIKKVMEFLHNFADKCHHGKEEDILFPAMVSHGIPKESGPIAAMLNEHQLGREYIKSLSSAFEKFKGGNKLAINSIISSSNSYVELLRNHIKKENNILFIMADNVLNETEQSKIFDAFEKLEVEKIGIGKHEEYHHLLKELKSIYLH